MPLTAAGTAIEPETLVFRQESLRYSMKQLKSRERRSAKFGKPDAPKSQIHKRFCRIPAWLRQLQYTDRNPKNDKAGPVETRPACP